MTSRSFVGMLLTVAALVGCVAKPPPSPATTGPLFYPPATAVSIPSREDWRPRRCNDLTVTFSDRTKSAYFKPQGHLTDREAHQYEETNYTEIAECGCLDTGSTRNFNRYQMTGHLADSFAERDLRVNKMSLVETSPLGKFSDFDLTGSSAIGEVATAVRMIWRGQCYLALTSAWARVC
jgi:hypothetical protein